MTVRSVLMVFFVVLFCPTVLWAEATTLNEEPLYRLTLGVSVHSTDFDVNDSNSNIQGTLSEDFGYAPFITLGSPYRYFSDTNFGWYMEYGLSAFRLEQQLVNDELVDLGTSVKGYYAYVSPVLFYNFGGRSLEGHSFKFGVGAGAGYLKAKGDIILTETPTMERHEFNVGKLGLAVFVLTDYRYENFMIRASGAMPTIEANGREYDIFAFSMDFGYTFSF